MKCEQAHTLPYQNRLKKTLELTFIFKMIDSLKTQYRPAQ